LERFFADANIQAKDSGSIQLRNPIVIVVRGSKCREWKSMIGTEKEECVAEICRRLDRAKCIRDVFGDSPLHSCPHLPSIRSGLLFEFYVNTGELPVILLLQVL
jgi:hypothetical protein